MQAKHRSMAWLQSRATEFVSRVTISLTVALVAGCAGIDRVSAPPEPAIVVSERLSAYQDVADVLRAQLPHASVHYLDGSPAKARTVIAKLRQEPAAPVIAIGSLARKAAASLPDRLVVYCQDFDPENTGASQVSVRGVMAVPPVFKQLQAWKMLDPELRRVTLVSGPGMAGYARDAQAAARHLDVELDHVEVQTDRELLYTVKRLDLDVQGVWFAPDNRVLSVSALRETLGHNLRHGRQSLVFSPQLLGFGGVISIESDAEDIAARVLEQLRADSHKAPALVPLRRAQARINVEIAKQLGLDVPTAMQGGRYVF